MKRLLLVLAMLQISLVGVNAQQKINGHEYVDLGLSVKWATCNVGASSPEEYGDYFAWGETSTKETYVKDNCPTYGLSISQLQSQGYIDGEGNLTAQYDAATANWGGDWRMPTEAEMQELEDRCTWTWTTQNSVNGYKVTGPSGASIFLPAAGERYGSSLDGAGSLGYYWSSAPGENDDYAYSLDFISDIHFVGVNPRYIGQSVRPCKTTNNVVLEGIAEFDASFNIYPNPEGHEYVDLGLSVKWATCNVGASSPEEYGDYFAWGETSTKETYDYDNCSTWELSISQLQWQGYIDSEGNLTAQCDAARANWGGTWRMPTEAEMQELLDKCTWTWTTQNSVNGYKVTGPSGASIFLPAAGHRSGSSLYGAGSLGSYWGSTPYDGYDGFAYTLDFYSSDHDMGGDPHSFGLSVRPVLE